MMKHIKMVNNYTNTKEMKMKNKVLNIAKEVFTTTGMVLGAISIITLLIAGVGAWTYMSVDSILWLINKPETATHLQTLARIFTTGSGITMLMVVKTAMTAWATK